MSKDEQDYLVYLFLLNSFAALWEGLSDVMIQVFFLTIVIPLSFDGSTPAGTSTEIIRSPVISIPVRNILSTPFFRRFSVIYYPNLYRAWGNSPLIPLLTRSTHLLNGFR